MKNAFWKTSSCTCAVSSTASFATAPLGHVGFRFFYISLESKDDFFDEIGSGELPAEEFCPSDFSGIKILAIVPKNLFFYAPLPALNCSSALYIKLFDELNTGLIADR